MTSSMQNEIKKPIRIIRVKNSRTSSMKEKQAFLLFFPIVLFGLLSKSLDNLMDCSKFSKMRSYFKFLYELRFFVFIVVITFFCIAKKYISSKYVMYILYAYNLMLSATDICIITQFTEDYEEYSSYIYTNNELYFIKQESFFGILYLLHTLSC